MLKDVAGFLDNLENSVDGDTSQAGLIVWL